MRVWAGLSCAAQGHEPCPLQGGVEAGCREVGWQKQQAPEGLFTTSTPIRNGSWEAQHPPTPAPAAVPQGVHCAVPDNQRRAPEPLRHPQIKSDLKAAVTK